LYALGAEDGGKPKPMPFMLRAEAAPAETAGL
jgi:hypothetical protein